MPDYSSKWRSVNNQFKTRSLFVEFERTENENPIYTLKNVDVGEYKSLYRLFIELEDTTEYTFANTYLEGWEHWLRLSEADWFRPYIDRWRSELELLHTARAIAQVKRIAAEEGRNQLAANKLLIDLQLKKSGAGRPSKARIQEEASKLALAKEDIEKDYFRLSEAQIVKDLGRIN